MTDIFDEISDDLRQAKLNQFWKENGNWIIGGAIGAVLLTGLMTFWRQWEYQRNTAATAELSQLVDKADMSKLESFAAKSDKNHAMMARFLAADTHLARGEKDKARALYDDIASTIGLDSTWRDLARLRSIGLRLDKDPPEALEKELDAISGDNSTWRYTAREMQALLAAREGKMQHAAELLAAVAADPQAPDDARQRAFSLRELYVADAKSETK